MTVYFKAFLILVPFPFYCYPLYALLSVAANTMGFNNKLIEFDVSYLMAISFLFACASFLVGVVSGFIDYLKGGRFLEKSPYVVQHVVADDPNEKCWSNTIHGNRHHRVFSFEKVVSHDGLLAYALYFGKYQLRWGKVR